jgi:phosphoglycerate dehydrogenase-like enzyme
LKNILIDMEVSQEGLQVLQSFPGVEVTTIEHRDEPRVLHPDLIRDCHVLFCSFPPTNIDDMKSLELIQVSSAGYSQLHGLQTAERGAVRACNALGVFDVPIAEWNIAMMTNLARDLRRMIRNQDGGLWDRSAVFQREIRGARVGIWGYGGIGRETARLAKAFGLSVSVLSRSGIAPRREVYCIAGTGDPEGVLPDKVFNHQQKMEFLSDLDFLILSMPLTRSTKGIVGESELHALSQSAFILNPARGPLIDEGALLKALREGWIAGAALDTHYCYPMPSDHPLWYLPNVIMTPHISGSNQNPHFVKRVWQIFIENVSRWLAGRPLLNELTSAQLAGE